MTNKSCYNLAQGSRLRVAQLTLREEKRMKKVMLMFVLMVACTVGCNSILNKGKGDKILATTDTVYLAVRVIVTDPGVLPKIGTDDLQRLVAIEKAYLFAREKHLESSKG